MFPCYLMWPDNTAKEASCRKFVWLTTKERSYRFSPATMCVCFRTRLLRAFFKFPCKKRRGTKMRMSFEILFSPSCHELWKIFHIQIHPEGWQGLLVSDIKSLSRINIVHVFVVLYLKGFIFDLWFNMCMWFLFFYYRHSREETGNYVAVVSRIWSGISNISTIARSVLNMCTNCIYSFPYYFRPIWLLKYKRRSFKKYLVGWIHLLFIWTHFDTLAHSYRAYVKLKVTLWKTLIWFSPTPTWKQH